MAGAVCVLLLFTELTDALVFWTVGAVLSAIALGTWTCLTIQCPKCRARIAWLAVRDHSMNQWFGWLTNLASCPKCGFTPVECLVL
jgi:hypothetical protein